ASRPAIFPSFRTKLEKRMKGWICGHCSTAKNAPQINADSRGCKNLNKKSALVRENPWPVCLRVLCVLRGLHFGLRFHEKKIRRCPEVRRYAAARARGKNDVVAVARSHVFQLPAR